MNYIAQSHIFAQFFLLIGCGHCKAMAPAWEQLAEDYKDSKVTLIGEVDCTVEDELCEQFEIQGFPTLHYGDVNDVQDYTGGRDYDSMKAFAKDKLETPICSIHNRESCTQEVKDAIAELEKKPADDLHAIVQEFEKSAEEADALLEAEIERTEEEYAKVIEEHSTHVDKLKASTHVTHVMALIATKEEKEEEEF